MTDHEIKKAMAAAADQGAWAGDEAARGLWKMDKGAIIEIALRLGARAEGQADTIEAGLGAVGAELGALRFCGIV